MAVAVPPERQDASRRRRPEKDTVGDARLADTRFERRRTAPLVLLVDDLEDQRDLYRQYLEFAGFRVETARDGFEAVARAPRVRPDVVVMDLAMPGMDGFEATERLKRLEATRRVPVIALTAHAQLPSEWALSAGCASVLRKPCYPHDLAMQIAAALGNAGGGAPPAAPP
jgi:two-component system cell cycle response regulator DivK